MLQSAKEERSRHFKLALRVGIPLIIFILLLAYTVIFHGRDFHLSLQAYIILGGMTFVIVYFVFFALELSNKETLLDRVTGSYHYESFVRRLIKAKPKTLVAVQIDNLSNINENFGVSKADEILKEFVKLLNDEVLMPIDSSSFIGRTTGAEVLLAINSEPEVAKEALSSFIKNNPKIKDIEVELHFAVIRNSLEDPTKAIEQLRNILAQKVCLLDGKTKEIQIQDALELSLEEKEVINALENRDIELGFRPLLNLKTNQKDIYEISVRMRSSSGKFLSPKIFLPVINRHNLGQSYDLLIFQKLISLAPLIDDSISFTFNISPFSLRSEKFLNSLFDELNNSKVKRERFIIELYERRRHHRLDEYLKDLKEIKKYGLRLCLDNFGTSNASMEYLRHFPFDMIQFDRDYTLHLKDEKSLSVLKSFVTMAKDMKMLTVAKWIDDKTKLDTVKSLDIDYIQGYVAGKIVTTDELIKYYNPIKES